MGYKKFKNGIYTPINPAKYIGRKKPEYRSSWEMKFFVWCDKNPNVLEWASESTIVPYISPVDGRPHRYFVDFAIALKEPTGVVKYLIEIKPECQTKPPKKHGNKKQSTILYETAMYAVNQAKWEAAKKWASQKGFIFKLITEKELNL